MNTATIDYASERRTQKVRALTGALLVRWLLLDPAARITENVESSLLGWSRESKLALARDANCAGKYRDRVPSDETWTRVAQTFGDYVAAHTRHLTRGA